MMDPTTAARLPQLQRAWQGERSLRIEHFLIDEEARELLAALRELPHAIKVPRAIGLHFLYYELALEPEAACDHVTCRLARWLFDDGRSWLAELTGLTLAPPPDGRLTATAYGKGSYLDAHNDADGARSLAYVIGLTPASWPADEGGHLEFLEVADGEGEPAVRERRAPGWNTLDIFDVARRDRVHRIPIVTEHHERRAVSGWFYR